METKRCSRCKQELPVSEFGKDKQKSSGLASHCRNCRAADIYAKRGEIAEKRKEQRKSWNIKDGRTPEQKRVHSAVQAAVKRGSIVKPAGCMRCGVETRLDAHHTDYSKPLDVLWLCRGCHKAEHVREKPNYT